MKRNIPIAIKYYFLLRAAFIAVVLLFVASLAQAITKTWLPTNGGAWTTDANWIPSGQPSTGDDVVINSSQSAAITGVPSISLLSLTVSGDCILSGSGAPSTITVTGTFSVSASVILTLGAGTDSNNLNVTLSNTCIGTINGTVRLNTGATNGIFTNSGNLTISSAGLIDDITDFADFTLSSGATLQIGSIAGITTTGATGNIQVEGIRIFAAGANYMYNGTSTQATGNGLTQNIPANLTINNSTGVTLSATTTISGLLTMTSGTLDMANTNLTVGSLTGSGDITNSTGTAGAITLTIGSDNTSPAAHSGVISDGTATSVALTKTGSGILTLSGASTYTGLTTISAGTLKLGAAGSGANTPLGTTGAGTTVSATGAALDLNGFTLVSAEALTLNGTGVSSGGALTNSSATAVGYSGLITLGSASSIVASAGDINVTNAGTMTGATLGLTLGGSANGSISSIIGTTSGTVTKNGTGSWTLSGASTYTGLTTISAGTLKLGAAGSGLNTPLGTTGAGTTVSAIGAALDLNGFTLATAEALTLNGTGVSSGGALTNSSATPVSYSGAITLGSASSIGTTGNITLGANGISGGNDLTKVGAAELNLGTGAATVNNLTITSGTLISTTAILNIAGNFSNSGTFTHNNGTVNYNGGVQAVAGVTYNNLTLSNGGNKNLLGPTTIAGALNLTSGVLQLGSNDLTFSGTSGVGAITGTGSSTNMIETNGTGRLIFNAILPNIAFNGTYPLGLNGTYNPLVISGLTGDAAPRTLSLRVVSGQLFVNGINRYWEINQTGVTGTGSFSFKYNAGEASGDITKYQPYTNITGSWALAPTPSAQGANPVTSTTAGVLPATSLWTASSPGNFYSYQSGNWNNASTWTTDPGGTTYSNPSGSIPGYLDVVTILSGRTVTLTANVTTNALDVTINSGGFLDLSTFAFSNGLKALSGQGTLKLSSANFPTSITNTFVLAGGGTTEYNANISLPAQATYNNLTINTAGTATLISNVTLNGNLLVKQGTFQINDASAQRRQLTINGNVTVNNGASFTVGTGVTNTTTDPTSVSGGPAAPFTNYYDGQSHKIVVKGDFTNNGTVRFTNLTYPVYNLFPPTVNGATTGFATVYFQGSTNNTLTCNGQTDFYNLVLDKGSDQTFSLSIYSPSYNNFRLFGANIAAIESGAANPNVRKALWIRTGTLYLQGLTIIPSLSEGTIGAAPTSDYFIPGNGALILDGPFVTVLSSSDDYTEVNAAYSLAVAGNAGYGINVGSGGSGIAFSGKLQVNDGYLSTRESGGLTYWSYGSGGQFIINGGTVDTKQFHNPQGTNVGLISYFQTGGNVIFRGRFQNTINYTTVSSLTTPVINTARVANGTDGTGGIGTLSINSNTNNGFSMSGGTLSVYDACGTTATNYAFYVGCAPSNINVTGGTVQIIPTTGSVPANDADYIINSLASFGNLTINRASGTKIVQLNTNPLKVLGSLNLISGALTANNLDVTIGGDFTLQSGTTYTPGTNTTTLNGATAQTFTDNLAGLTLNNFTISKAAGVAVNMAGSQTALNVLGNFNLLLGTLNDNGFTINVAKNVFNSGLHIGSGKIALNGTTAQTIDGNGLGIFNNLDLNNTNGAAGSATVSLIANTTVNGTLNLVSNRIFNIGVNNLKIAATGSITSTPGFSSSCYIHGSGNSGDGGITKVYNSNTAFVFPVGSFSTKRPATYAYTPATIGITGTPTYGSVTVIPVGYEHSATIVNNQSLTFFWRVNSTGFGGTYTVTHNFVYSPTDINGTIGNYAPSVYNRSNYTWDSGLPANINTATSTITDWTTSNNFLDGDYTAGDNTTGGGAFGGVKVYYSRSSGLWSSNANWTFNNTHIGPQTVSVPGVNDAVDIGANHTISLTNATDGANQYALNFRTVQCASLQIDAGATFDLDNNPGSVFTTLVNNPLGNGLFRLTTTKTTGNNPQVFAFPLGDFSDFNNNGGTTEFYDIDGTTGALYILPANVTTYGNLMVTAKGGDNLVLPNNSLTTIKGDLTCGGDNANAWITMSWNTSTPPYNSGVYNPTIEKTVHVTGNLFINTGTFLYMPEIVPQHLVVDGNVTVGANAWIDVLPAAFGTPGGPAVPNTLAIGGSLINNSAGYLRLRNGAYYCDLTFQGAGNATISGSSPTTILNKLFVNKGSSQATTLTCNIAGNLNTLTDNWLTLQNGTFIYNRTEDFNITTGSAFTIPSTTGLTINTPSNVYIANANSDVNTMFLNGKLTLAAGNTGNVYVGPSSGPDFHNDIEYSSGGASAIQIDGGNLIVNGQIRRNPSNAAGILSYTQSNGTVTINGRNSIAPYNDNAKLEVLNTGSQFNMSGGTLTIARGNGVKFGDLYLRPQTSSVTGGTIVFALGAATGNQTYKVDANLPLNHVTIGLDPTHSATVQLMVSPLTINGNTTINSNSTLDANSILNIPVTFKGNFTNSGTYLPQKNLTTFSGTAQSILGTTTPNSFYDLDVNPVTSLALNGNTTVTNNLTISSGILICEAYNVGVSGNFTNNSNYSDNSITGPGGVSLNGTSVQHIAGSGAFGWLELNNPAGAVLDNSITLIEHLSLSSGIFNIKQNLLTLQQNSTIDATGTPFNATKMVTTDGVLGNIGINKWFTTAPQTFIYPIGTSGKFTPATLILTNSGYVGSVRINNVNSAHPAVLDPSKVLKYYWDVESSGISGFQGNLTYKYQASDATGGSEIDYKTGWLIKPGTSWSINGGVVTPSPTSTLFFNYPAGTENLSGQYTAGEVAAFPADVPEYASNMDGDWNNPAIWSQTGGSHHTLTTGPNGFIVKVNHTVTANVNFCSAYKTTITGKLKIVLPFYGHNLGDVDGSGTLYLENSTIPAGIYDSFFDCASNSTIEYGGSGTYTIVADLYNHLANIIFSGTGTRTLPNKDLTICNSFKVDGPMVDNSIYNRKLTILGKMERYNTGVFNSGTGAGATVTFNGSAVQTIGGATGDFTGTSAFNNFEINNSAGININNNGAIEVNGNLLLTNGLIHTSTINKLTITNTAINCVLPAGGSATSYIDGPLVKKINQGDSFLFPIGQGSLSGNRISVSSIQTGPLLWTAQYFAPNSTSNYYITPLAAVSWDEYWSVTPSVASQAKISLGYYPNSNITPLVTENGLSDMRVANYNTATSQWNANASITSGDNYNGTVTTTAVVPLTASANNYTLASVTTGLAKAKFSPTGPVCGISGIPVTISASTPPLFNYVLSYTINGGMTQTATVTPAMVPYSLPTSFAGLFAVYKLTGFTYNNGAGTGIVDSNPVTAYASPTTSTNGGNQSQCGITSVTLTGNTPAIGTGVWSIVSGTGGSFINPSNPVTQFNGVLPNSYNLQWTISNGTCKSSSNMSVFFTTRPTSPVASATQNLCTGTTLSNIAVTPPTGSTVDWFANSTGGTALAIGTALVTGTTYYGESNSGGCISSSRTAVTVTLSAQHSGPTINTKTPNVAAICAGQGVSATFNAGSGGVGCSDDYTLSIDGGAATAYTGGDIVGTGAATSSVVIQGRRANCTSGSGCAGTPYVTLASWTVNALPTPGPIMPD